MLRRLKKHLLKRKMTAITVQFRFEDLDGNIRSHSVQSGQTVLQAARQCGIMISSYCGGMCSCGTCVVSIIDGGLTDATAREIATLGYSNFNSGERLACQARITEDIHVKRIDRY
jgi:ferredoxin